MSEAPPLVHRALSDGVVLEATRPAARRGGAATERPPRRPIVSSGEPLAFGGEPPLAASRRCLRARFVAMPPLPLPLFGRTRAGPRPDPHVSPWDRALPREGLRSGGLRQVPSRIGKAVCRCAGACPPPPISQTGSARGLCCVCVAQSRAGPEHRVFAALCPAVDWGACQPPPPLPNNPLKDRWLGLSAAGAFSPSEPVIRAPPPKHTKALCPHPRNTPRNDTGRWSPCVLWRGPATTEFGGCWCGAALRNAVAGWSAFVRLPKRRLAPSVVRAPRRIARAPPPPPFPLHAWGLCPRQSAPGAARAAAAGRHRCPNSVWWCLRQVVSPAVVWTGEGTGGEPQDGARRAPCPRCAKSRLLWTHFPDGPGRRGDYCVPGHRTAHIPTQSKTSDNESKQAMLHTANTILLSEGAHRALCPPCANSWLFSTTGSHGSRGPEFCTPDAVLNGSWGKRFRTGRAQGIFLDACPTSGLLGGALRGRT